jgi:hypothetical protein
MKKIIIGIVIVCITVFSIYTIITHGGSDNNNHNLEHYINGAYISGGRGNLLAEEMKDIFHRNEEAFDYIVSYLKSFDKVGYEIRILTRTDEIVVRRPAGNFIYTNWGFEKDELFEKYVKTLLIEEQLGVIMVGVNGDIDVGPNDQIRYSEIDIFERYEETALHGRLKENWFYAVHQSALRR